MFRTGGGWVDGWVMLTFLKVAHMLESDWKERTKKLISAMDFDCSFCFVI